MTNSKYATIGNKLHFIGYLLNAGKEQPTKYKQKYLVISFSALEVKSGQITLYSGAEKQIHQWANGRVPNSVK